MFFFQGWPFLIQAFQLSLAAHRDTADSLWHRWLPNEAIQQSKIEEKLRKSIQANQ